MKRVKLIVQMKYPLSVVPYLHSLVVVLNSPPLLWPLWVVGTMTAKGNPDHREGTTLVKVTEHLHHSQQPSVLAIDTECKGLQIG